MKPKYTTNFRKETLSQKSETEIEAIYSALMNLVSLSEIQKDHNLTKNDMICISKKKTINGRAVKPFSLGPFLKVDKLRTKYEVLSKETPVNISVSRMVEREKQLTLDKLSYYETLCETISKQNITQ